MIKKILYILTKKDKQFLLYLIFFSVVIALLETIGISIIMPFISVASDFSVISSNKYYYYLYQLFNFDNEINFVVSFGILLIIFYIFRSIINLFYFHLLARFAKGRYHTISCRLFSNYLSMSYRDFVERNSSELKKSIITETQNFTFLLTGVILMLSEVFVVIFIYSVMLYVNLKITLLLTLILVINAIFLIRFVAVNIKKSGKKRERFQSNFYEIINSAFGNFKIIKLKDNNKILHNFYNASDGFAQANIKNDTLLNFPRLFLEAIGFSIVIFIVLYLVIKYETNITNALALISVFVLGLYRLLPSANRLFTGYNQILYQIKALDIIYDNISLKQERLNDNKIIFNKSIVLNNVCFAYLTHQLILDNINLTINKGNIIAFIGKSGSGKTTLVDLIMGLYLPKRGTISIDNNILNEGNIKSWRNKIGYIPQNIYLFDGTVMENIVFGGHADIVLVKKVLQQANILDFLETKQQGINTKVGEGGIKLSGGQKQRIAIARALYYNPEILVLDEATSALDSVTEAKIMDEIYNISIKENKTLIIIAHRLSTISKCDKIYKITNNIIDEQK